MDFVRGSNLESCLGRPVSTSRPVSRQRRARTGCWAEGTAWPRVRPPCRGMTRRWRNRLGAWVRTLVGSRAEGGRQVAVDAGGRRRDVVAWPRGGDRTTGVGGAPIREQRRGCNRCPRTTSTAGTGLAIVCASQTSNLVQSTTNLKICNRTKSIVRGVWLPAASAPERCVHRVKPVIPYFGH